MMTPSEIERVTKDQLYGPFPYDDCRWLHQFKGANDYFIPDLDAYLADIVGFAATATSLPNRDHKQLHRYWPALKLSFFEKHPEHGFLTDAINEVDTPTLHQQLTTANKVRIEMLPLLEQLLSND